MKSYNIVCPSCQGKGTINPPDGLSSSTQVVCPACNGSKIVMVHETDNGINTYSQKHDIDKFFKDQNAIIESSSSS